MPDPEDFKSVLDSLDQAMQKASGAAQVSPTDEPAKPEPTPEPIDRTAEYQKRAEEDVPRIASLRSRMEKAARNHAIPVEYLEGVVSRETRAGKALPPSGFGGKDNKMFGIGQINSEVHELRGTEAPDSEDHLDQSAEILSDMKKQMDKKFPSWADEAKWRAAIAAYNTGPGNVKKIENPDERTDGHDYSQDVLIRAKTFRERFHTNRKRR